MISAMIIVFREVLEMALVLGVLLAATRGIGGSRKWIGLGALAGLLGACVVALFMRELEASVSGNGEFIFNAVVLLLAAVLIAWTVIWMSTHGRELSMHMQQVGSSVSEGTAPHTALAVVSLAAVLREGSEAVFFLFGAAQATRDEGWQMLAGGMAGVLLGAVTGLLLYRGLIRLPMKHLFTVIGWLLMLLAAGMAAQAVWYLVVIDALPPLIDSLWNSSAWLPQDSIVGEFLHVLIGYDENPSGMQFLVYVLFLATVAWLYHRSKVMPPKPSL
jgi:high-affinity iron transporter